jgi:hypothetical protein
MDCQCKTTHVLEGNEAAAYADEHLVEVSVDSVNWTIDYVCPLTDIAWQKDYPHGELHGGGPPRLRKVLSRNDTYTSFLNTVVSKDGFSVEVLGRTGLRYTEGPRQMFIDSEVLNGPAGMAVYGYSLARWNPPHDHEPLPDHQKLRILENIRLAFRFMRFDIHVTWPALRKEYLPFDPTQGYPAGDGLFYECLLCGTIVSSLPTDSVGCVCGKIFIDVDYGRCAIREPASVKLFAVEGS